MEHLPIAPVLASAVDYRLPERRQVLANGSKSDQQETGVVDLLDQTFATYEDDLDVVFS